MRSVLVGNETGRQGYTHAQGSSEIEFAVNLGAAAIGGVDVVGTPGADSIVAFRDAPNHRFSAPRSWCPTDQGWRSRPRPVSGA